jgi:hypothetical protein
VMDQGSFTLKIVNGQTIIDFNDGSSRPLFLLQPTGTQLLITDNDINGFIQFYQRH